MKKNLNDIGHSEGETRRISWNSLIKEKAMRFFAPLRMTAFSLVELMISLIVISIVTAAFAPILTKKLKTSDQSIGTATATSITSSAICNSVSKGCVECEDDKCIVASDGYFLNKTTEKSQACNSVMTGCFKCSNATA